MDIMSIARTKTKRNKEMGIMVIAIVISPNKETMDMATT